MCKGGLYLMNRKSGVFFKSMVLVIVLLCLMLGSMNGFLINTANASLLPAPTLYAPSNGATGVSCPPTFSWSSVSGANYYWLTVAENPSNLPTNPSATNAPGCIIGSDGIGISATSYTPSASLLDPGTTYYWKVQAYHGTSASSSDQQGYYSSQWSFTTQLPSTSSSPQNLRVTNEGDGYVDLAWDPPLNDGGSTVTNYKIYRGTSPNGETHYTTISSDWTTFHNTGSDVTNGITYYYKVKAVNAAGDSSFSNEASATPSQPTTTPSPPGTFALAGTALCDGDIPYNRLSWTASTGAIVYDVYRGGSFCCDLQNLETVFDNVGVSAGVTYTYFIRATNAVGYTDSNTITVTTRSNCGVSPPGSFTEIKGIDVSHWQGDIDWSDVYNSGYRFAFVKATEGDSWTDKNFVRNMNGGNSAGVLMGSYHFARPDLGNDAIDEAQHFINVAGSYLKSGYLRPVLDLEVGSNIGIQDLSNWVHTWMNTVKSITGVQPILYVNSNYANNYLDNSISQYDLWIAYWTYDSKTYVNTGIWNDWDFWQYSNQGSVPGINGNVDLDIFNGDTDRLDSFIITSQILTNNPPNPPTILGQFMYDSLQPIPIGGTIDKKILIFKAYLSDLDEDKVRLEIELRKIDDNAGLFQGRYTQKSGLHNNGRIISAPAYGLANADYHWQARTVDEHGYTSEWVTFGNNENSATDFSVIINSQPLAIFSYHPESPELGEEISFDASESYDPDGGPLLYEWDLGNGVIKYGKTVYYSYQTTGTYIVTLKVIDDEGTPGQNSVTVGVFSSELRDCINEVVQDTKECLNNIYHCNGQECPSASNLAFATDYFNQKVMQDTNLAKVIPSLAIDSVSLFFGPKQVSALSIGDYVKLSEYSPAIAALIDDHGWILAGYSNELLQGAFKIIGNDLANELEANSYSYYNAFILDLHDSINDKNTHLREIADEILYDMEGLTTEEINYYKDDLKKRSTANNYLRGIYLRKASLPINARALEIAELEDSYLITGRILGKFSISTLTAFLGGPILLGAGIMASEWTSKIVALNDEAKMTLIGCNLLIEASAVTGWISRNIYEGLENIKERNAPYPPDGDIEYIKNFAVGTWGKIKEVYYGDKSPFLAKQMYSTVKIKNNGEYTTQYEIFAYALQHFSTGILTNYQIPNVIGTERIELRPGESREIKVWYKNGHSEGYKPQNENIYFHLFGETTDGIYLLDYKTTFFGTEKIVTNNINVSEEELMEAPILVYPIFSSIKESSKNCTLTIYAENPFDFPVEACLLQQIPGNVEILYTDGLASNGNIAWQLEFEAEEKKEISVICKVKENKDNLLISAAILKFFDQINDIWIEFHSNEITFNMSLPIALFEHYPQNPVVESNVFFNASSSFDPNGQIISYIWDYGDKKTEVGQSTTHLYKQPGTYRTTLTVTDNDGLIGIMSSEINVVPSCGTMIVSHSSWSSSIPCGNSAEHNISVSVKDGILKGLNIIKKFGETWISTTSTSLGAIYPGISNNFTIIASPPKDISSGDYPYSFQINSACNTSQSSCIEGVIHVTNPYEYTIQTKSFNDGPHQQIDLYIDGILVDTKFAVSNSTVSFKEVTLLEGYHDFGVKGHVFGVNYSCTVMCKYPYQTVDIIKPTSAIKGDINGDKKIDVFDLDRFAQSWGATQNQDDNYNECFDFNEDGKIDVFDLDGFAQIWGKTYT